MKSCFSPATVASELPCIDSPTLKVGYLLQYPAITVVMSHDVQNSHRDQLLYAANTGVTTSCVYAM